MFLTPLQALTMVALTVLLASAAMILIHLYMPFKNRRFERMETTLHQLTATQTATRKRLLELEQPQTVNIKGTVTTHQNVDDDPMALWDAIIHDAKRQDSRR